MEGPSTLGVMAVWSAEGEAFDVDAFLARFPSVAKAAHVWRKGEPSAFKRRPAAETSGFNLWLGEGPEWSQVLVQARKNLQTLEPVLTALAGLGLMSQVDFGFTVGLDKAYVRTVGFNPEEMAWFAERGIEILVTAYPLPAG